MRATIDDYMRHLDGALIGPGRLKQDMLTEARHGLVDAVEGYREAGLPESEAERQAVAEFGTVVELAPAYQAELAMGAARQLALRLALVPVLLSQFAQLMWWRAPWTASGPFPPDAYVFASDVQDHLGYVVALMALSAYGLMMWSARRRGPVRRGLAKAVGVGAFALVAVNSAGGFVLYVWSVVLWNAALTWPPMLLGGGAIMVAYWWLGRSAATCVAAARLA
ncbi:permease prefix domain 1-containing protein [Phytohabitans aurantiacus]|nr:permease prefix domain 1-containing protein [Phytohabitans aurantiacus]